MAIKTKTITLLPTIDEGYVVRRITDSLEYRPGTYMKKATAKELCDAKDWKVTIIAPDEA